MLTQVLKTVADGGIHSLKNLARQLDVTEPLVEAMLEDLEKMGYLKRINTSCTGRCQGCESNPICAISAGGQIWSLTQAGLRQASLKAHE